jgi:hypothetical protein
MAQTDKAMLMTTLRRFAAKAYLNQVFLTQF